VGRVAHYDGVADWYDRELATAELGLFSQQVVLRIIGEDTGRLLDLGCGSGPFAAALAERGWHVTGVDISEDQLRLARSRGVDTDAGFRIERYEEPAAPGREYPHLIALRCRR
jgi:2-polyprenyl-3-methyl-5-hydroxy-6-metoxy-1,4-benzoquinol methylase